jgi:hypothetical protein
MLKRWFHRIAQFYLSSFSTLTGKTFKNFLSEQIVRQIESKPEVFSKCELKFKEVISLEVQKQELSQQISAPPSSTAQK